LHRPILLPKPIVTKEYGKICDQLWEIVKNENPKIPDVISLTAVKMKYSLVMLIDYN